LTNSYHRIIIQKDRGGANAEKSEREKCYRNISKQRHRTVPCLFLIPVLAEGEITYIATGALTLSQTIVLGTAIGAIGSSVVMLSKPNSGPIRYSDNIGKNPDGSKMTQSQAEDAYRASRDPKYRLKLKNWMKGQGYRRNHLKGLIFLPLFAEWERRLFGTE